MPKVLYRDVDLLLYEGRKHITINPRGERFYFVGCDQQDHIYRNATLSINDEGRYVIEGDQTFYTEHKDISLNRETLLCEHPQELIRKRNFLGLTYYRVRGVMNREVHTRYVCQHPNYKIEERVNISNCSYEQIS